MEKTLTIKLSDLWRATLENDCGNEGYIGISPDGSEYHVVVPVDRQIARGLKFYDPPADGTPFGGLKDWNYFCCLTYAGDFHDTKADREARLSQTRINGSLLEKWGAEIGVEIRLVDDLSR
jgi:hypothetical protein